MLIPAALVRTHPKRTIQPVTGFGWKASVLCHGLRDVADPASLNISAVCSVFFMNF